MTRPTNFIFDLTNPDMEMLVREGEKPTLVVLATTEDHNEQVLSALTQLQTALAPLLDPSSVFLLLENRVELDSGQIIELNEKKLLISLKYPTVKSRLIELTLDPEQKITLH